MTLTPVIYERNYSWGPAELKLGTRTQIMGILNVTPDSFSDGGRYNQVDLAVAHAIQMMEDGADLIDIGGESTRPGSETVSAEEELSRIIPVIEALQLQAPHIPISVDTYKAEVARQAILAGAHIINDVWGAKADPDMARTAADLGCPIILMHNRPERDYRSYLDDVVQDLQESIQIALDAGVHPDQIILDPGIGFVKDLTENLTLMSSLGLLNEMGYPVLLATSRKRFIQNTLQVQANDAVEGTAATVAFGIAQGCQMVRVHDVKPIRRTADMCDAMLYASPGLRRK
ncbi:dihydropteroate synthase [Paenibacillus sp. CC-CFT742]|uniref:dihydropteroate synthase n=1 Tax=Paenibacillus TaxID=44249 RepID=UPI00203F695F|nr:MULTISPECIES: dihydropteroate synthase [Paenibacillus]MCM3208298.1 dihydropteroate synthase [Paenibacillus illinoisensis]WJH26997.1 dihydropteroate synthase [Paenibacillus sp. CC-CFT742]